MHISADVHKVDPESIQIILKRFDNFISVDINFKSLYLNGTAIPCQYGMFIGNESNPNGLHDALVTLRSVFPNAVVEDCR